LTATRVLLYCAVLAYLAYLLGSVLSFLVFDHHSFVDFFKAHYPSAYRIDEYGKTYFSLQHYEFVSHHAILFALVPITLFFIMTWKRRTINGWVNELIADISAIKNIIVRTSANLTNTEKVILITCFASLAGLKTYFFFALPFHLDETFNFIYFTDQGIFHSSTFANNHPLTNILSSIWWKMDFSPELSFRLTSILSSFAIHILIYSITTHFFNFKTGIFVLMLSGVTFWGNVYAIEGVAYMLMSLWVLLALVALLLMDNNSSRGQPLFIASSILGFYTTQLFIIPFVALVILWISLKWYNDVLRHSLRDVIISLTIVATGSLLLYFPMYLRSGFDATFHSDMSRHDLIRMSPALIEGFSVMTDVNSKSYVVVLGLIAVTAFYLKRANERVKFLLALNVAMILSILIFSFVIGMYPPSRALVFTNISLYVSIGVLIADLFFRRLSDQRAMVSLCLVFFVKIAASAYLFNSGWQHIPMGLQDTRSYQSATELSTKILRYRPNIIFSDERDTYINFSVIFLAIKNGQHINFTYDRAQLTEADVVIINNRLDIDDSGFEKVQEGDFGRILTKKFRSIQ
jgi:hypothetical protein